ncbi:MAG: winged helix-turn-helix transcriptional regulator [Asgard group archaeon]|nr:winged helix-turn-helix transcriptional regulator [Asgard group archaeon]
MTDSKQSDYTDFKPKPIQFLSDEEMGLVIEYTKILTALRKSSLTAKDIHNLYYDEELKKYLLTIKTIYRYLEKLENAGLIKESGYRITKGTRVAEKLYARSANLFYPKFVEGRDNWWEQEDGKVWSNYLSTIIGELFPVIEINHQDFYNVFKKFAEVQHKTIIEVLDKSKDNETVASIYSNIDIEKVNKLNYYVSIITAFLKNPELVSEFNKLLEKKQ